MAARWRPVDGYEGLYERTIMSFTCPTCGATSHNPHDESEGYCGRCHWWTGDPVLAKVQPFVDRVDAYCVAASGLERLGRKREAADRRYVAARRLWRRNRSFNVAYALVRTWLRRSWTHARYPA